MRQQLVGDAFLKPIETGAKIQSLNSATNERNERTELMPQQFAQRTNYQNQRLAQLDKRIQQSGQRIQMLQDQFNQRLPLLIQQVGVAIENANSKRQEVQNQQNQFNQTLPLKQQSVAIDQQNLALKQRGLDQQQSQFEQTLPFKQQSAQVDLANLELRQKEYEQRQNMYEQELPLKQEGIELRKRKAGMAANVQFPDGTTGSTTLLTQKDLSKMQDVINAWPQFKSVLSQIARGAKYFTNNPDGLKKYEAAITATWTGKASPKDEKLLEDVGVSSQGILQAQELQSGLMNLPKLQETYSATEKAFTPQKGETLQSFLTRIAAITKDNALRYHQAIFNSQYGVPADEESEAARDKYVKEKVDSDPYINAQQEALSGKIKTNAGHDVSMKDVDAYAKQMGVSQEEAIQHIKETF
jgi:hypothetical protein